MLCFYHVGGNCASPSLVQIIQGMVIDMNEAHVRKLEQLHQVLAGTQALEFRGADFDAIASSLRRHHGRAFCMLGLRQRTAGAVGSIL